MRDFKNLKITEHPLVQSKLSMLRDKNTGNKEFRELVKEIAIFVCYEATKDAPLTLKEIETPLEERINVNITERKYALIPILRAGLGMVEGIAEMLPTAKIGHIGIFRDEKTRFPIEYHSKLPVDVSEREVLVIEPMIATGGTILTALKTLKKRGCERIKILSVLVSPESAERIYSEYQDVYIYAAALDKGLNDKGYIVPGLGDAGDRLFGTK